MKYEIHEVNKRITEKKLQSELASHNMTLNTIKIMDEVRKQIGLKYPFEEEKK